MIEKINKHCHLEKDNVCLGIGDDAAILTTDPNKKLVITTDTLVEGIHFKNDDDAQDIGHKTLAVNLSDLAAMGVKPQWVTLNLTMPEIKSYWLDEFIKGFATLLHRHGVALIGGDTTQGPCSITVTAMGEAPLEDIKTRQKAQVGDLIAVTGNLGGAAYALAHPYMDQNCDKKLHKPEPRLDMIPFLQPIAKAMIDVSDGLLADLGHICLASQVGAQIQTEQIPVSNALKTQSDWLQHALAGGDDYELCFTLDPKNEAQLPSSCKVIGIITNSNRVEVLKNNQPIILDKFGFTHFKN